MTSVAKKLSPTFVTIMAEKRVSYYLKYILSVVNEPYVKQITKIEKRLENVKIIKT